MEDTEVIRAAHFSWENSIFECECEHKVRVRFKHHAIRDRNAKFLHSLKNGHRIRKICPECRVETAWWHELRDE